VPKEKGAWLSMPSREFSKERIVRSVEKVLSNRDINYLSNQAYTFIHLHAGSIAHFSLEGWKHTKMGHISSD
jgi:hypothetical protein